MRFLRWLRDAYRRDREWTRRQRAMVTLGELLEAIEEIKQL